LEVVQEEALNIRQTLKNNMDLLALFKREKHLMQQTIEQHEVNTAKMLDHIQVSKAFKEQVKVEICQL